MSEQVLVIPKTLAKTICPTTYSVVLDGVEKAIMASYSFREREEAEHNFDFKQVIPYIIVVHPGDPLRYLLSQRTSKQQESRLHNKHSIGQGGHINSLDFHGKGSPIVNGLMREITEEFTLSEILECLPVGVINDDSDEVSRVHMGLVYMLRVGSLDFQVAEEGKHTALWASKSQLPMYYESMENWSRIIYDSLIK